MIWSLPAAGFGEDVALQVDGFVGEGFGGAEATVESVQGLQHGDDEKLEEEPRPVRAGMSAMTCISTPPEMPSFFNAARMAGCWISSQVLTDSLRR